MKTLKLVLLYVLSWTWALSQNLVGLIGYLIMIPSGKHRRERYNGAWITYVTTDKKFGGVSLGMFIFIDGHSPEGWTHDTRIHEFGHCIQSILLGPLYWFVVAIPSVVWCNFPYFKKMHDTKETKYVYYKLYCEGWANVWGAAWTGETYVWYDMLQGARYGKPW